MRISFLNIKDYRHQHNLSSGPIGLAFLSSAVKHHFPGTHVQIEVDPEQIIYSKPDIVGITAFTEVYSQSIEAARYIRRKLPHVPILIGGPHINALPLTITRDFDIGAYGESEDTFVDLVRLYREGHLTPDYLKDIPGIVYWDGDQRKQTPARDVVQDLDLIIPPDRSVMKTYWPPSKSIIQWPQPIYTSRGCPFKCVFCIFSMDSQKVRYHSVDRVVMEIEDILRHHPEQEHITIHDDLFALSKKRLAELTAGIRSAGLHKKVSFICMAKASIFNDEMAKLMRDMNVSIVTFGLESGVERILKYLKGERNKVEDNVRAIDVCAKHGIRMGGYFIIGTPHETYEELQQAYWFIRHHFPPMSMVGIYRLTPFPGTKFWQEACEKGIVSNDLEDWRPFNYLDHDKRDYLFFNEHYSLQTFKQAYEHFTRITDRNHLAVGTERQELGLKQEIEPIYREVLNRLQPGRILELSGFTRMLAEWIVEEEQLQAQVDLVRPWEFKLFEAPADGYDLIIVNLALEQMLEKASAVIAQLHHYLANGGRVFLICYYPQQTSLIAQLLAGRWNSDYWGSRPFDMLRFYGQQQLSTQFAQGIAETREIRMPVKQNLISSEVLAILQQIPGAQLAGLEHIAYTMLSNPIDAETEHGRHPQATGEFSAV